MGKDTGFMDSPREVARSEAVHHRIAHFREFRGVLSEPRLRTQASRCMNCGVPFCNWGCPVNNLIPEFCDLVYHNQWKSAYGVLQSANNFPEFTGRVCPAPCEASCCSAIVEEATTIRQIELAIIEKAFASGLVRPINVLNRSGHKVAIVGSGPAGLAAARQLNLAGHQVVVFEKNEVIGGLLALGIPDFKLEKHIIKRRLDIMEQEGIVFKVNHHIGKNIPLTSLKKEFDAICLTGGAEKPRDLDIEGRDKSGIHFAMDFLTQQNRIIRGQKIPESEKISAKNKTVTVIGGGDTGADCVGTAIRQGAYKVTQLEIMPRPPKVRHTHNPWPYWPKIYRQGSSIQEGCEQIFSVKTQAFLGEDHVSALSCVRVDQEGSDFTIPADLVLLATGFVHPVHVGLINSLGLKLDDRGNVWTDNYQTSIPGIFAAGDMITGQSLVVNAVSSGRNMAQVVDQTLKGYTHLT